MDDPQRSTGGNRPVGQVLFLVDRPLAEAAAIAVSGNPRKLLDMVSSRSFSVLAYVAPDLGGGWVSHCLDLDLVAQGVDIQQALEAISEATVMALSDDMFDGVESTAVRSRAPEELWKMHSSILATGRPLRECELSTAKRLATQLVLSIANAELPVPNDERVIPNPIPPSWRIIDSHQPCHAAE